jgi:hypothetical protein
MSGVGRNAAVPSLLLSSPLWGKMLNDRRAGTLQGHVGHGSGTATATAAVDERWDLTRLRKDKLEGSFALLQGGQS